MSKVLRKETTKISAFETYGGFGTFPVVGPRLYWGYPPYF
jgi:hypothetical protein